jgi:RNA polymerase sigma-70 factor (ECF subfamily)
MQLFAQHQRSLYVYLLSLVRNVADAEDLLQETNIVLWKKFGDFQTDSNFAAWARRVAHLEALKFCERRRRSDTQLGQEFVEQVAARLESQPSDLQAAQSEALAACLEKLAPRDRDLISARYAAGGSSQRVAESTGRPARSVYKSVGRIRRQLLECINRQLSREESA